jgi:hypothetical protein
MKEEKFIKRKRKMKIKIEQSEVKLFYVLRGILGREQSHPLCLEGFFFQSSDETRS